MIQTITHTDFFFQSSSSTQTIRAVHWQSTGDVRGVVQIAHGVAEHMDRYDDFARFLCENGFAVFGCDHLGHGHSAAHESDLGWFAESDGWGHVVTDLKRLHDIIAGKYPGKPIVLFGHSMGSFLARTYMICHPEDYAGVILSGTGQQAGIVCRAGRLAASAEIKKHGSKYRSSLLQSMAFGSYLKGIESPAGPNDWLSRDTAVVAAYTADPLCGYVASAGLMRDMMSGLDFIRRPENLAKMRKLKPVFFLSGDKDPVGAWGKGVNQAAASFIKAGMRDVKIKLYPGGRHEMLNELNKHEVYGDILSWLNEKI